jgi:hypothetical protein
MSIKPMVVSAVLEGIASIRNGRWLRCNHVDDAELVCLFHPGTGRTKENPNMSIFSKIVSAIFGSAKAADGSATPSTSSSAPGSTSVPAGATPLSNVDVEKVMSDLASKNKEKLDWKKSIVDLMKLLNLDSSIGARKELATELGYTGDMSDSASMNIWLHKQVMQKLAANGGKVPADLAA